MWPFTRKKQVDSLPDPLPEPTAEEPQKEIPWHMTVNKKGNEEIYDLALKLVTTKHGIKDDSTGSYSWGFKYPECDSLISVIWKSYPHASEDHLVVSLASDFRKQVMFPAKVVRTELKDPIYAAMWAERKRRSKAEYDAIKSEIVSNLQEALK